MATLNLKGAAILDITCYSGRQFALNFAFTGYNPGLVEMQVNRPGKTAIIYNTGNGLTQTASDVSLLLATMPALPAGASYQLVEYTDSTTSSASRVLVAGRLIADSTLQQGDADMSIPLTVDIGETTVNVSVSGNVIIGGDGSGTGTQGPKGDEGDSAYEVALANGFVGTQAAWLASLKGDKGDKGDTGEQGLQGQKGDKGDAGDQGIQGIQGVKGDKGDKGDTGDQGPQGIQGVKGDTGNQGIQGVQGNAGADGKTILYGTSAPANGTGNNGDFYINTATNFIYGPKASGVWPGGVSLIGPQGPQGIQGTAGTNAPLGLSGITQVSGNYTLLESDNGKVVEVSALATITLPNGLSNLFRCDIVRTGTGEVTLSATTTLRNGTANKLKTQYRGASVYHAGSNVWQAIGTEA